MHLSLNKFSLKATILEQIVTLTLLFIVSVSAHSASKNYILQDVQNDSNINKDKSWDFLSEYSAIYQVSYDGDVVGTANETLTFDNDVWKLKMSAQLQKLFFKVNSIDYSEFSFDKHLLRTQRFYSKTKMTFKKDKVIDQIFDWNNKIETGSYKKKSWQIPLEQQVYDRMSQIIQLRNDLMKIDSTNLSDFNPTYLISHKGKYRHYTYNFLTTEILSTPFGKFEALKLQRVKKNGDKFVIWLSPKLNYFPIKISQKEKGESEISFLLESFILTK